MARLPATGVTGLAMFFSSDGQRVEALVPSSSTLEHNEKLQAGRVYRNSGKWWNVGSLKSRVRPAADAREQKQPSHHAGICGTAPMRDFVYGCLGAPSTWPAAPVSTIRPLCITATRVASCATTGRLCEIRIKVRENSLWSRASNSRICAPTETSSADTGSSAITSSGLRIKAQRFQFAGAGLRRIHADNDPSNPSPGRLLPEFPPRGRGASTATGPAPWTANGSPTIAPTRIRGFSDATGS